MITSDCFFYYIFRCQCNVIAICFCRCLYTSKTEEMKMSVMHFLTVATGSRLQSQCCTVQCSLAVVNSPHDAIVTARKNCLTHACTNRMYVCSHFSLDSQSADCLSLSLSLCAFLFYVYSNLVGCIILSTRLVRNSSAKITQSTVCVIQSKRMAAPVSRSTSWAAATQAWARCTTRSSLTATR